MYETCLEPGIEKINCLSTPVNLRWKCHLRINLFHLTTRMNPYLENPLETTIPSSGLNRYLEKGRNVMKPSGSTVCMIHIPELRVPDYRFAKYGVFPTYDRDQVVIPRDTIQPIKLRYARRVKVCYVLLVSSSGKSNGLTSLEVISVLCSIHQPIPKSPDSGTGHFAAQHSL